MLMKPGQSSFDDPAGPTETAAVVRVAFGEQAGNAYSSEGIPVGLRIVSAVALYKCGFSTGSTALAAYRRDRLNQRQKLRDVVGIGSRYREGQWDALGVGQQVMLGAALAPVGRAWACLLPPKTARTEALSTMARDQSIPSAWCRCASKVSYTASHTPNSCQSRRRRQHVTPLPQPISCGKYDQGIPVRKTKRIPTRARRLETAGRPLLLGGLSGGRRGSMCSQSVSGTSARAIYASMQPRDQLAPRSVHRHPKHKL